MIIHRELVDWFLENACPHRHVRGGPDHLMARHTAMSVLMQHPGIARDSRRSSPNAQPAASLQRAVMVIVCPAGLFHHCLLGKFLAGQLTVHLGYL